MSSTPPGPGPARAPAPEAPDAPNGPDAPDAPGAYAAGQRTPAPATARSARASALLAAGLLFIAVNLRIAIASVGPVLDAIRHGQHLSAGTAGLLTTVPVVCFGAFAFVTPTLTRRFGAHRLLGLTMLVLAAGILIRLEPSTAALFGGTVLVGASVAVANVLMPGAVKRDFAHRAGLMMGLYSTALFVGAALASGLTVPVRDALGVGWRGALAVWAVPAGAAFLLWLPRTRRREERGPEAERGPGAGLGRGHGRGPEQAGASGAAESTAPRLGALLRDRTALAVTAFMGLQSLSYYATLSWVPTLLQDAGMPDGRAGWMLSYSAFPGIAASMLAPVLARRLRPGWLPVAAASALCAAAYAGLAAAPTGAAYLWMTVLGLGQGAAISLALSFIVWRSPDPHHTGQLSTLAQGAGYLVAGLGPFGLGAVHAATGGWRVPLAALGAVLVLQTAAGVAASRDRHVLRPGRA
jgi:CP family cyanate transporter-like MFS transporter